MPGAFAKVLSYGVYGIDAYQVTVELDVTVTASELVPSIFQIVGLPEGAVKESRERVRAAIGNSGFWKSFALCEFRPAWRMKAT